MKIAISLLLDADILMLVTGFIVGFAAHVWLQFRIDFERVKAKTGRSGWTIFGRVIAPADFYRPEAGRVWKVRDLGLKTFAVGTGVLIFIIAAAAVADVPLQ